MNSNKLERLVVVLVLAFFSFLICYPLASILPQSFEEFGKYVFKDGSNHYGSRFVQKLFLGFKAVSVLLFIAVLFIWVDSFTRGRTLPARVLMKVSRGLVESFRNNVKFVSSLGKNNATLLGLIFLVQIGFYFFFVCSVPLHYDEWVSYYFFSGKSFWTTMTFYPFPNNHIFYNLVSRVTLQLPIDAEITLRLPAFISSILCTYYFFKICKTYFGTALSMMLVILCISSFHFVLYSFESRGYSFVNLFCVLLMYAGLKLSQNYSGYKYRILFVLSLFLGLYSVPSFLYALLPVCLVLGIYVLKQKQITRVLLYCFDGFVAIALAGIAYGLVLHYNNPELLLNPNGGSTKFSLSDQNVPQIISQHLQSTFVYLFNYNYALISVLILLAGSIYYVLSSKSDSKFVGLLALAMICSPMIILPLHRVIPFERTWLYLLFPAVLCLGMLMTNFLKFKFAEVFRYKNAIVVAALLVCLYMLAFVKPRHKEENAVDYELSDLRDKKLEPLLGKLEKIGSTYVASEFYTTEELQYFCFHENPKRNLRFVTLDSVVTDEDLLVIDGTRLPKFSCQLSAYEPVATIGNSHVFLAKKFSK